jgi:hypothetical protein
MTADFDQRAEESAIQDSKENPPPSAQIRGKYLPSSGAASSAFLTGSNDPHNKRQFA